MKALIEYVCEELEELERKADKDGKLSMAEVQYMDTLAHTKKNLLKADEMMDESEYSMASGGRRYYTEEGGQSRRGGNSYRGSSYEGGSYARGRGGNARRDSRGRYSRNDGYSMGDSQEIVEELRELMNEAPDDKTRMEFQRFIQKIEQM